MNCCVSDTEVYRICLLSWTNKAGLQKGSLVGGGGRGVKEECSQPKNQHMKVCWPAGTVESQCITCWVKWVRWSLKSETGRKVFTVMATFITKVLFGYGLCKTDCEVSKARRWSRYKKRKERTSLVTSVLRYRWIGRQALTMEKKKTWRRFEGLNGKGGIENNTKILKAENKGIMVPDID